MQHNNVGGASLVNSVDRNKPYRRETPPPVVHPRDAMIALFKKGKDKEAVAVGVEHGFITKEMVDG